MEGFSFTPHSLYISCIINHKSIKMKKIISSLLILTLIFSCANQQTGTAIVKNDDELTLNTKKLLESYINNDFSLWEELISDDCEILFNNIIPDKNP